MSDANLFNNEILSKCLVGIRSRAERLDHDQILESFSSVGPFLNIISTDDHQVIFGRRGTGKTHALKYLYASAAEGEDCAIFVDMLNLGSDVSIYNDSELPIEERATRLLIDTLKHIQDGILDYATSGIALDLANLAALMDDFNEATSKVRISGGVKKRMENDVKHMDALQVGGELSGGAQSLIANLKGHIGRSKEDVTRISTEQTGDEHVTVRFPNLAVALRDIFNALPAKRVWVLIDEWSSIPVELQPFLADMLKRTFFNIQKVTLKIAAIEHRTRFLHELEDGSSVGLEPTSDIRNYIRLDDYLLFDNDSGSSFEFFKQFFFRHVVGYCKEKDLPAPRNAEALIAVGFNQKSTFDEFVKSVEGVPRDAIHIMSDCAQRSYGKKIDTPTVRTSAYRYYQEDKSSQVENNPVLRELLKFIVDDAIRSKRTNSFLLEFGVKDRNVDLLFDRRLVHIRQRNVSSRDNPGARYYHYKIDYGCYVGLMATQQMPKEADFREKIIEEIAASIDVPTEDDARSYRRSILNLESFYSAYPSYRPV